MNSNNKGYKDTFFFFIDCVKESESDYLKINNFFHNSESLCHNKYFSIFPNNKIDFNFLEKNEKLLSFFFYYNNFFFKDQIKNLKRCLLSDQNENKIKKGIPFFLNFFYFLHNLYFFIFLLKKFSFIKRKI